MTRVSKGILGIIGLLGITIGAPIVLFLATVSTWPSSSTEALTQASHLSTGTLVIWIVIAVGWFAWASLLIALLIEGIALAQHKTSNSFTAILVQQRVAAVLLGAVALLFTTVSSGNAFAQPQQSNPTSVTFAENNTTIPSEEETQGQQQRASESSSEQEFTVETSTVSPAAFTKSEPIQTETHTVAAGESLWSIAQDLLGDGARWKEIFDLNVDQKQSDGSALDESRWLNVGWVLQLPATETTPEQTGVQEKHTVEKGESLWAIAESELDDPTRWPEIYELNKGEPQPTHDSLKDPNLIHPGWSLTLPSSGNATAPAEQPEPTDATTAPDATEDVAPTHPSTQGDAAQGDAAQGDGAEEARRAESFFEGLTPHQDSAEEPVVPGDVTDEVPQEPTDPDVSIDAAQKNTDKDSAAALVHDALSDIVASPMSKGIGTVLASSLFLLLAWKSTWRRRTRELGMRTPTLDDAPERTRQVINETIASTIQPISVSSIDRAMRHAAQQLAAQGHGSNGPRMVVHLADHLEVIFSSPATLATPWAPAYMTADGSCETWTITASDIDALAVDLSLPSPWPGLVTLGRAEDSEIPALVMADIERLGTMTYIAPPSQALMSALTALTLELATSPVCQDVDIVTVGLPSMASVLDTGSVREAQDLDRILDEAESVSQQCSQILSSAQLASPSEARVTNQESGLWPLRVLITAQEPTAQQRERIEKLAMQSQHVGFAAVIGSRTESNGWSITLDPADGMRGTLHDHDLVADGVPLTMQQVSMDQLNDILVGIDHIDNAPDNQGPVWAAQIAEDQRPLPQVLNELPPLQGIPAPALVQEAHPIQPAPMQNYDGPVLEIFSHIDLVNVFGTVPPSNRRSRALELIAYLAFLPEGASAIELNHALWPTAQPKTVRNYLNLARKWLGADREGASYFPLVQETGTNKLHGVRTSWDLVLNCLGEDITQTPLPQLSQALDLITGRPFDGTRSDTYAWAEPIRAHIIESIIDFTYVIADRAMHAGDIHLARKAISVAHMIDPLDQRSWRQELTLSAAVGDGAVEEIHQRLDSALSHAELDHDDRTAGLLSDIQGMQQATSYVQ